MVEAEIEMVRRHVRQGAETVRHQREMVGYFRAKGYDVTAAQRLLGNFEDIQEAHLAHLKRLLATAS